MSLTLYEAYVPTCRQLLGSVANLLDKAEAHCAAQGWEPDRIISAKLAPDMFDFAYQVKSCYTHSLMAIEKAQAGEFGPNLDEPPRTFAGLKALIADTIAGLEALDPEAVNAMQGKDADFRFKTFHLPFTAENFLLSFAQPNFHFHTAMTYAILRMLGVEVGKFDYIGAMRRKEQA